MLILSINESFFDKSKKLKSTHETRNIDSDSKKVRYKLYIK
ncbi:hypothetical protein bcere0010_26630 [Bacillus cereus ATCC 4342]|nr:hypothetical protein bcere0010_26630 [Bacillus cereus ATCC 4342]